MNERGRRRDEAGDATTFFNRGRRYAVEIVRDNEQLRAKVLRLEQALRGATAPEGGGGLPDGEAEEP